MKECYIRFMAPINGSSTEALLKVVDSKIKSGYEKIHLMITSPGGSVAHGLALYNILRSVPIRWCTYNIGSVDSIGVVVFCAGEDRFAAPNSRFLIHPVQANLHGNHSLDEHKIRETMKSVQADQKNIVGVVAHTTGLTPEDVEEKMHDRTTWNAQSAKEIGLTQETVEMPFIPAGAEIIPIHESSANPQPAGQIQLPGGIVLGGQIENYTSMYDMCVGQTRAY